MCTLSLHSRYAAQADEVYQLSHEKKNAEEVKAMGKVPCQYQAGMFAESEGLRGLGVALGMACLRLYYDTPATDVSRCVPGAGSVEGPNRSQEPSGMPCPPNQILDLPSGMHLPIQLGTRITHPLKAQASRPSVFPFCVPYLVSM